MNKTIVVSGGTKGIGRAIIEKFASEGFDVVTCARDQEHLEELAQSIQTSYAETKIYTMKADLSSVADTKQFVEFVKKSAASVDVLVNNTGTFVPGEIHSEAEGALDLMINTNLYSAYHLSRGLIPQMIENKQGDIFNICSVAGLKAYPNGGSYSISKFAMHGLSMGLREELKPYGIRVTSVHPGATLTASWEGVELPEERFIKSSDVADAIWGTYQMSRNSVIEELVIRPQLGDI
ncbi:SDR family oxidoreductase [Reichenbachiella carrageenanivorans]|uniref:SDR family oxidoreductase n=1 Tax=Reichenbachiella carrageenanivorans TaxID=2979869 RepID=A0ABY6D167_9BACT|nr:SDR family oxidoreductase [Reichenbachiella carrageenanivorans]UXX79915.1 SDR family oxidoreductase [Reichenbachiella carrageenanivorans]